MTAPHVTQESEESARLWRLIGALADATMGYPFKLWGFGESIAMHGLLGSGAAGRAFAEQRLRAWALDPRPLAADPLAHVAPGVPLLVFYRLTRAGELLPRAVELAELLDDTRRGRHGARIHRPGLAGWEHEVWVDCMHLDGPFLVLLGRELPERRWIDLGVELLMSHARVLQDEGNGLFSHGFDDATGCRNQVFWGRGQGWALLGLVDTLRELLGVQHAVESELRQRLTALVTALAATEEADTGRWHTVVDAPDTYIEPSVSALVAHGISEAIAHGLIDRSYASLAERAWQATLAGINPVGELVGVSDATPVGQTALDYNARPRGVFPWGQGPALLAIQGRHTELLIP